LAIVLEQHCASTKLILRAFQDASGRRDNIFMNLANVAHLARAYKELRVQVEPHGSGVRIRAAPHATRILPAASPSWNVGSVLPVTEP